MIFRLRTKGLPPEWEAMIKQSNLNTLAKGMEAFRMSIQL